MALTIDIEFDGSTPPEGVAGKVKIDGATLSVVHGDGTGAPTETAITAPDVDNVSLYRIELTLGGELVVYVLL